MTIWCNSCKCHVSSPCTSHHLPQDHLRSVCRRFRSTKGASKARRDHINHEIRNMRALLPISQEDQERLSYLHSMAAICTYIRKSVLLQGLPAGQRSRCSLPYEAFLEALHGFILVTTSTGKLVYVSENVAEYTGVSMVDVLQGDTLYDMVERADVDVVQSNLSTENNLSSDRSFICCMQSSKAFKLQHGSCCSMLVRGRFQLIPRPSSAASPTELLFVALCTPTVNRLADSGSHFCHSFSSSHGLDMSFTRLSDSVLYFLGYSADEMTGRSWYSFVHPEDLSLCADSHRSLITADKGSQVEMVLRLQRVDLSWIWIYVRAYKDSECQSIICTNFIISQTEVTFLQKKISSDAFKPSSVPESHHCPQQELQSQSGSSMSSKRQRTSNSQSEEPATRRRRVSEQDVYCALCSSSQGSSCDSPVLFTPPYSPASSCSALEHGELSHDLLMVANECTDQLLSSPEGSPSYYSYPEARLTCHLSPADSLPAAAEQSFDQRDLVALSTHSPLSSSSPSYDFQACTSHARLVPDCLSVSDMCESPVDSTSLHPDDFDLLEQPQGGGFVQLHHVPHQEFPLHPSLLPPTQTSLSESSQYNEREQAEISILAQQISSLASSFNRQHTMNVFPPAAPDTLPSACDWPHSSPHPSALLPKRQLGQNVSVLDSILKDHNMVTGRNSASSSDVIPCSYQQDLISSRSGSIQSEHEPLGLITEDSLPAEQFTKDGVTGDRFSLQPGHHEHNTELHQLTHHMQSIFHKMDLLKKTCKEISL
ncbi:neuronal PAS domain-containing protein 4-like [Xenentodon cancila]